MTHEIDKARAKKVLKEMFELGERFGERISQGDVSVVEEMNIIMEFHNMLLNDLAHTTCLFEQEFLEGLGLLGAFHLLNEESQNNAELNTWKGTVTAGIMNVIHHDLREGCNGCDTGPRWVLSNKNSLNDKHNIFLDKLENVMLNEKYLEKMKRILDKKEGKTVA